MKHHVALRRQEVARLAADGASCRAISAELGISPSTASRDIRALAAISGPPGTGTARESVEARYVASGASEGGSYASVAERVAEIDRLLSEWRTRATYQTAAAGVFARLLQARHTLSASECTDHIAVADARAQIQATADRLIQVLKDAQEQFEQAGMGEDTEPVIARAYKTAYYSLGSM